MKAILAVLCVAVCSVGFCIEQAQAQASTDWYKTTTDYCKGDFEPRSKCIEDKIKALEARANIADINLNKALARLDAVERTLKTLNSEERISNLERSTIKVGQVVTIQSDFRKQCMHWYDTNQPPIFIWCGSGPDPRDETFALFPR